MPIPVTGGILGLRSGWTHRSQMASDWPRSGPSRISATSFCSKGLGWSDVNIFDAAGLRTFTARSEESVSSGGSPTGAVVPQGHCGVGAGGAADGVVHIRTPPWIRHLLLAYPFAGFFYVSPDNQPLAYAIQTGFERAIADGSYQRLVEELIFTPWLRRTLLLKNRRVIVSGQSGGG